MVQDNKSMREVFTAMVLIGMAQQMDWSEVLQWAPATRKAAFQNRADLAVEFADFVVEQLGVKK